MIGLAPPTPSRPICRNGQLRLSRASTTAKGLRPKDQQTESISSDHVVGKRKEAKGTGTERSVSLHFQAVNQQAPGPAASKRDRRSIGPQRHKADTLDSNAAGHAVPPETCRAVPPENRNPKRQRGALPEDVTIAPAASKRERRSIGPQRGANNPSATCKRGSPHSPPANRVVVCRWKVTMVEAGRELETAS